MKKFFRHSFQGGYQVSPPPTSSSSLPFLEPHKHLLPERGALMASALANLPPMFLESLQYMGLSAGQ